MKKKNPHWVGSSLSCLTSSSSLVHLFVPICLGSISKGEKSLPSLHHSNPIFMYPLIIHCLAHGIEWEVVELPGWNTPLPLLASCGSSRQQAGHGSGLAVGGNWGKHFHPCQDHPPPPFPSLPPPSSHIPPTWFLINPKTACD